MLWFLAAGVAVAASRYFFVRGWEGNQQRLLASGDPESLPRPCTPPFRLNHPTPPDAARPPLRFCRNLVPPFGRPRRNLFAGSLNRSVVPGQGETWKISTCAKLERRVYSSIIIRSPTSSHPSTKPGPSTLGFRRTKLVTHQA